MSDDKADKERSIREAARRALDEAAARKKMAQDRPLPTELGGRDGPEPTRYGDWEKDGVISDF